MPSPSAVPALGLPFIVTGDGAGDLTGEQLRHRRFARRTRGVRLPAGVALDQDNHVEGVMLAVKPEAVVTDVSAARLWGLPLPPWLMDTSTASVSVRPGSNRHRREGVRGRRLLLPEEQVMDCEGLRVTSPARTWLDCSAGIPAGYTLAMADALVRRSLASVDELQAIVAWGRGRRGVKSARLVLPWIDAGAESPAESVVRFHILEAGLPRPVCNLDIFDREEWLARADIAWPEWRIIVEYDGAVHLAEGHRRRDAVRRNLLQDAGWLVIVLTGRDLHRPEQALGLIRSSLVARGWRPPLPASGQLTGRKAGRTGR